MKTNTTRKKIYYRIYYVIMFLPLIVTLAALPFLPEQIPAHYGFDNKVNRWGSKYEALLFPIVTIWTDGHLHDHYREHHAEAAHEFPHRPEDKMEHEG